MFLVALLLACMILMVALNMSVCWFQNKVKLLGASHQLNWSQSDSASSLLSAQKPMMVQSLEPALHANGPAGSPGCTHTRWQDGRDALQGNWRKAG